MNFPTSIHQTIAHFIPGFLLLMIMSLAYQHFNLHHALKYFSNFPNVTIVGFIFLLLALFTGLIIDAIRTGFIHKYFDDEIDSVWKFIKVNKANKDVLNTFEQYYYVYFVFEINTQIAMSIALVVEFIAWIVQFMNIYKSLNNFNEFSRLPHYFNSLLKGDLYMIMTIILLMLFSHDGEDHKKHMLNFIRT